MLAAILITLLALSLILIIYLYRSASNPKEKTREHYAFKCLSTISALAVLCIASISSKTSLLDQALALIARISGNPIPEVPPAPVSEHILLVVIFIVIAWYISKSHENWNGQISADEEERRRMKRATGMLAQGIDEAVRLVKHRPQRKIYVHDKRLDSVTIPSEPNLVWHDHARELFELWMPVSSFPNDGSVIWNNREKTWHGRDRAKKQQIYVYCDDSITAPQSIHNFKAYTKSISTGPTKLYAVVKTYPDNLTLADGYGVKDGITFLSEDYLYSQIVDFSDYYNDITRKVETDAFAGSDRVIKDIYTPSKVSSDPTGTKIVSSDFGQYLSEWSCTPAGKQVAIMGEYGQGKSTGALMYVYDSYKSNFTKTNNRIPILIELRGKSPANLSPAEMLGAWAQQYQLQAAALMKLLIAGKLIIIFEGFDEMANIASAETRIAHFRSLWMFSFPKSKIIFTGRRNLFFEDNELNVAFKGSSENSSGNLCDVVHLCPFDSAKIKQSLRWMDVESANEIIQAASSNIQIFDIVSRPSLLYIVASLWSEMRLIFNQGGISSAQVIDAFVTHSYARQELKERNLGFMKLTRTERRYFHEGIAVYMASTGSTNQITAPDLTAAIQRLYNSYPEHTHISDVIISETDRPPLKLRLVEGDDTIETILTDVRTHGILVNDLGQRGAFRFAHKSFYEMLAAKAQAYSILDIEPVFYRSIKHAMDGVLESVKADRPEILSFFSEFFIAKIRMTHNNSEIALLAFDNLVGTTKPKTYTRKLKLAAAAALHSVNLTRLCIAILIAMLVSATLLSTDLGRTWLGLELLKEKRNMDVSLSNWAFWISFMLGIIYATFTMYSTSVSSRIRQKSRLWVAVLISADNSTRSTEGISAVIRILGKTAARDIITKACDHYSIYPANTLGLNIPHPA